MILYTFLYTSMYTYLLGLADRVPISRTSPIFHSNLIEPFPSPIALVKMPSSVRSEGVKSTQVESSSQDSSSGNDKMAELKSESNETKRVELRDVMAFMGRKKYLLYFGYVDADLSGIVFSTDTLGQDWLW